MKHAVSQNRYEFLNMNQHNTKPISAISGKNCPFRPAT